MSDQLFKQFNKEYDLSLFYWINKHVTSQSKSDPVADDPINQLIRAVQAVAELARYYFADDSKELSSIVVLKDDFLDPHKAEVQELAADQFMTDIIECFPDLTIDHAVLSAKLSNNTCSILEKRVIVQSVLFINQAANEGIRGRRINVSRDTEFICPGMKLMQSTPFQKIFDSFKNYKGPLLSGDGCLGISKKIQIN